MTDCCRYCKSPAAKRPCWWYLDHPKNGGDPPCECDPYYDEPAKEKKMGFLLSFGAAIIAVALVYAVFGPLPSWAVIPIALCVSVPLVLYWRS